MSFTKLFEEVDNNFYQPFDLIQNDTSSFDRSNIEIDSDEEDDNEDDEKKEKSNRKIIQICEPEINQLRNCIYSVRTERVHHQQQQQLHIPSNTTNSHLQNINKSNKSINSKDLFFIPEIDWEKEVSELMIEDSNFGNNNNEEDGYDENIENNENLNIKDSHGNFKSKKNFSNNLLQKSSVLSRPPAIIDIVPYFLETKNINTVSDPYDILFPNTIIPELPLISNDFVDSNNYKGNNDDLTNNNNIVKGKDAGSINEVLIDNTSRDTTREEKDQAKIDRIRSLNVGFDATSGIGMGPGGKRSREDISLLQKRNKNRAIISSIHHNIIASKHKNTKSDLSDLDLRCFHRPRMTNKMKKREWKINFNSSQNKEENQLTSRRSNIYSEADKRDLTLIDGDFICVEYIEEIPPILLNYGMASAILNYYRSADQRGKEEKRQKKQLETVRKIGLENNVNLPRHVKLLLEKKDIKKSYEFDPSIPRLDLGETKVLAHDDESPFLGDITCGEIQPTFVNNLYRAPFFQHKTNQSDFLLIRTKTLNKQVEYAIREIPRIFTCGQMEPQQIVMRPTKSPTKLQESFFLLASTRYFQNNPSGADFNEIQDYVLRHSKKKHGFHGNTLKKILRTIADEVTDSVGDKKWYPKDIYDHDDYEDNEYLSKLSPDEIEKSFSPEDVCLQESTNSAELRLSELGIIDIELSRVEQWLHRMTKWKEFKQERELETTKLYNMEKGTEKGAVLDRLLKLLKKDIKRLDRKLAAGRFIFDRLVIVPWNTTFAFVKSHLERDDLGKMQLRGQGDPSGRGEGFAFVRLNVQVAAPVSAQEKKKQTTLVGTDADLRKITKADAIKLVVSMGMSLAEAGKMERWDRVHMIKVLSAMAQSGGVALNVHKFARGETGAVTDSAGILATESFQKICQDIWRRQKEALTVSFSSLGINSINNVSGNSIVSDSKDKNISESENNKENDESENDDDSDDGMDMFEGALENRDDSISASFLSNSQVNREIIANPTSSSSTSSSKATSNNKKKDEKGEDDEKKELMDINNMLGKSSKTKEQTEEVYQKSITVPSNIKSMPLGWVRPQKVVKELRRIVTEDGRESIKVRFIVSEPDVKRVENQTNLRRKYLSQKVLDINDPNYTRKQHVHGFEVDEDLVKSNSSSKSTKSRGKNQGYDYDNEIDLDGYKPTKTTRNAVVTRTYRMPHVNFAARLEKELMEIWASKKAFEFREPVPREIPGYYEKIKYPICLLDIRDKIAEYRYTSIKDLMNDMNLMAQNSQLFNGPSNQLTKNAFFLVEKLRENLDHDRNFFGAQKDTLRILEDAIKKKFIQLNQSGKPAIEEIKVSSSYSNNAVVHVESKSISNPSNQFSNIIQPPHDKQIIVPQHVKESVSMDLDDDSSGDEEVLEEG